MNKMADRNCEYYLALRDKQGSNKVYDSCLEKSISLQSEEGWEKSCACDACDDYRSCETYQSMTRGLLVE